MQLPALAPNTLVTGAASTLRVRYPRGITDGGDGTGIAKFGPQELNGYTITAYAGGTQQTLVTKGVAAVDMKSTIAPAGFGINYGRRLSWYTERPGGPVLDGWACWGLRLTAAFTNPGGVIPGDLGIVIWCGNGTQVNGDGLSTAPGVIFGPNNANNITLRARRVNAGPQTVTDVVPAGNTPDLTKFNTYELRIVTGSPSSDPQLFGLINGRVVTGRHLWTAAAAVLPPPDAIAGNYGYVFAVVNRAAGGVPNMYVKEVLLTAAQSEADLN